MHDFDVVIIGCGPVGGLAANLLGKAGLRTLVLEREAEPHPLPRAVHIDHEVMRLFQDAGLVDALSPLMRDTQGHMHIGADGGVIRYLGTAGRPRPFAWANDYFFYQPELEAELRRGLGRFPHVELQLGTECLAVAQDDAGVNLEVGQGDRRRTVRARWAIACDGASSATRKGLGVKLDDLGFEEPWLVIDAEVDGPLEFSAFTGVPEDADLQQLSIMLCDPRRPATLVPGRGDHRRWEFMLLPGEDATPSDEDIRKLIAPWTAGATSRVIRAATYRFHGLIAEHWRAGSVFLAGDAAHQTPPFFGQGMCHGMRDVANLVWKLRLVRDGLAGDDLLETYQTEREPQVRAVIAAAVEAGRYICMLDPELAAQRDAAMRARFHDPVRTASDLIPAIKGVTLAGAGGRFIQPWIDVGGRRMRLDDFTGGGFVLIERRGDGSTFDDHLGVRRFTLDADLAAGDLAAWLDERGADALLLRPDFYVFGTAAGPGAGTRLISALSEQVQGAREEACVA